MAAVKPRKGAKVVLHPSSRPLSPSSSPSSSPPAAGTRVRRRKPPRRPVVSLHPSALADTDVATLLADSRDEYTGQEQATLYACPSYVRTCVDRLRARVKSRSKPGVGPTVTALVQVGLEALAASPEMRDLVELKERFDHLGSAADSPDEIDAWLMGEVADILRKFSVSLSDQSLVRGRDKTNYRTTEGVRNALQNLAGETGMSSSSIALLSLMIALQDEPCVLREWQGQMRETVGAFLRRSGVRLRIIRILLDDLDGGQHAGKR